MIQRFFVHPQALQGNHFSLSDKIIIHQMTRVLRMRPSSVVIFFDGDGYEYKCEIQEINDRQVSGAILSKEKNEAEPLKTVILYQAMPKKMELFEMVLQKGTEIGVKKFVPLITERTERHSLSKLERLHAILKEAAEQSGRGMIPELGMPVHFEKAIIEKGTRIVFDPSGEPFSKNFGDASPLHIFVGPEGGFSKSEIDLAKKSGAKVISLGKLTLRTETAGIIGPSLFLL